MSDTHLNEILDTFLDIGGVRLKSGSQLSCHLIDKVVMRHMLAVFHDANNACLEISQMLSPKQRIEGLWRIMTNFCLVPTFLFYAVRGLLPLNRVLDLRCNSADLDLLHIC